MSKSLQPRGLQYTRVPCPSLSPWICSNSCPLSQWCHPAISASVAHFFSCPQSFPALRLEIFIDQSEQGQGSCTGHFLVGYSRVSFLYEMKEHVGAGWVTYAEQATLVGWPRISFPRRAKHRNIVKFWFADMGLTMSSSRVSLSVYFNIIKIGKNWSSSYKYRKKSGSLHLVSTITNIWLSCFIWCILYSHSC